MPGGSVAGAAGGMDGKDYGDSDDFHGGDVVGMASDNAERSEDDDRIVNKFLICPAFYGLI